MTLPKKKSKPLLNWLGYTLFFYGPPKIGKSSLFKHTNHLYLAFERGLKALSVYRKHIENWEDAEEILTELEEGGHERYSGIVVDTVEKMATRCMKAVCEELNIDHPQDAPYGKGWEAYRRGLEDFVARLEALPIPTAYISHSQVSSIVTRNREKSRISPKLSGIPRSVILSQVDGIIYVGYGNDGETRVLRLIGNELIEAGGRYLEAFPDVPKRIKYRQSKGGHNFGLEDLAAVMKPKEAGDGRTGKDTGNGGGKGGRRKTVANTKDSSS